MSVAVVEEGQPSGCSTSVVARNLEAAAVSLRESGSVGAVNIPEEFSHSEAIEGSGVEIMPVR